MKKNLLIISIGLILGISIGYYMLISEQQVQRIQTSSLLLLGVLGIVVAYLNTVISSFLDKNISWKKKRRFTIVFWNCNSFYYYFFS